MKWVSGSQFLKQHKLRQAVLVFAASEGRKMPKRLDRKYPHLGGNIIGGDRNTFYPALWSWLVRRFDISTVLDVGCGEGHAMAEFSALGCEVHGIDGLEQNIAACTNATVVDLTITAYEWPCDLVWCCEVVEHIDERFVDNLVRTLSNGRYIAMTHGLPGQSGYHHVNCKPTDYWVGLMNIVGYRLMEETLESRSLGGKYWKKSGLIFTRT
jgi:2-polyprenyl-3-methyl-5-hydroxy-6-metoxy-1,4-benzoquinol methylase